MRSLSNTQNRRGLFLAKALLRRLADWISLFGVVFLFWYFVFRFLKLIWTHHF